MRYLKYFENNNPFYQEISDLEFKELLDIFNYHGYGSDDYETKQLMFDYDEFDHIKKISTSTPGTVGAAIPTRDRSYSQPGMWFPSWKTKYSGVLLKTSILNTYKEIYCYKMEDEWYLANIISEIQTKPISVTDEYYKCDQFEGLLELIKTKGYR